ncbi:MAG: ATP-binding protein [Armatimonadetes bacterium]|nr:ATP-binding protein [Armatimonadota bacterium]
MREDPLHPLLEALRHSPDNSVLRAHLVRELLKARRWIEAQEHSRPLLEGPQRAVGLLAQARGALFQGLTREAADYYRQAIGLDKQLIDEALEAELETEGARLRVPATPVSSPPEEEFRPESTGRVTFADVGGMAALKEKIRLLILYPLQKPEIYAAYGKKIGGGLLLYGPPGCGKTHIARATAGEIGAKFYVLSLNEVLSMWLGESEKQLSRLFDTARRNAPSVIFIDEVDALGAKRSDFHSASNRAVVSQFLVEMDGVVANNEKVMVLGATNMPWNVDSALRRPGRFDRVLFVPPPDQEARLDILRLHVRGRKLERGLDLSDLAGRTAHFSGADLAHLVETATERALADALRGGVLRDVTGRDFHAALKECKPSTMEWLRRSRNYVNFANQDGVYDDLASYLEKARIR